MPRYVISYASRTASETGGNSGTLFYAQDDEAALVIQEALAAAQSPQAWKSVTAAVTVIEGRRGASTAGTREIRLNVKHADETLGYYHFPLVAAQTTHEQIARLLIGEKETDHAAPVSPQGSSILAIVKSTTVNMR